MFCENEDCDRELTISQVADGESFCSSECLEESLRMDDHGVDYLHLWDDPEDLDEDDDEY